MPTPKRPRGRPKGSKNKGAAKTRVRREEDGPSAHGHSCGEFWEGTGLSRFCPLRPFPWHGWQWVLANWGRQGDDGSLTSGALVLPRTMGNSS